MLFFLLAFLLFLQFRQNSKVGTKGCNTCHDYRTADRYLVHRATGHLCHNKSKSRIEHRLSNMDAGVSTILHASDTSLRFSPD